MACKITARKKTIKVTAAVCESTFITKQYLYAAIQKQMLFSIYILHRDLRYILSFKGGESKLFLRFFLGVKD